MKIEFRLKKANKDPEITVRGNTVFFNLTAFFQLTDGTCDVRNCKIFIHSAKLFKFGKTDSNENGTTLTLRNSYGKRSVRWKTGLQDGKYKLSIEFPFAEIRERIV